MPTTIVRSPRALAPLALVLLLLAGCLTDQEQSAGNLVNDERARAGVPALRVDGDAQAKAQAWAGKMAAERRLSHSNMAAGIGGTWTRLGENVATGSSVAEMHQALMSSPHHRARILDAGYTHAGIGIAKGADGRLYTAQVFITR